MLNKDEIIRKLEKGTLLVGARRDSNGQFDVEPDSYDLTAGIAVWKEELQQNKYEIKTLMCTNGSPLEQQPTITVQPGQMIFVITREEVNLPLEICGTVYSRNNIALEGILALNAGHVDPGYQGPIVIRLINLKATPWTLHLGNPIFTITFQTVDHVDGDKLESGPIYPMEKMLDRVRKTAENSLSNALFDLYSDKINIRLNEHYTSVQQRLRDDLTNTFLPRSEIMSCLFKNAWAWIITGVVVVATVGAAVFAILQYYRSP
jgi:deoxycytidine triphosphate deaminase